MSFELPQIADGEEKSSPLANCIRNNYRHIRKWAKRTGCDCFRLYDREIHHVPLAIDFYAGRFSVQYYAKGQESEEIPASLQDEAVKALQIVFGTNPEAIFWRTRARSKTTRQYEKRGEAKEFFTVQEYGAKFWINLTDYLDTGLFLDHRETRQLVASMALGKRVLNLFAYTCSFSVHAALHGASFTKSVDMSNTYTAWGEDNFILNSLSLKTNVIVRADCLKFLDNEKSNYDLIIIDPPTLSRSKKMEQLFDLQVDYIHLISKSLKLLSQGGVLIFSTNSRKFHFDEGRFPECSIVELTAKTIPLDFRNSKIHRCWKIVINSVA